MNKAMKSTIILAIIMLVSKLSSFVRDIVLTNQYGASYISDAFLVSISVPTILFSGIVSALFTCYIPLYKEIKIKDIPRVNRFNSNVMTGVFLLSILFVMIYWSFDGSILRLFAVGFDDKTFLLAQNMTRIMTLSMLFMGISYILQGYLQANGSFYLVGAMTIPTNIIIAISIGVSTEEKIMYMAWGTVIGYAIYILYFGVPAYIKGFRWYPYLNLKDEYIKKLLIMTVPIFVGQIMFEINAMIDKSLASTLPEGSVTALDYAYKVATLVYGSVVAPISTIIYPKFSEDVINDKIENVKVLLGKTLRVILIIIIPIVGGIVLLSEEVIKVLFFRGAFSLDAVKVTSEALIIYAGCILPVSLRIICEKIFYAKKETKIPMINSLVGIIINIILNLLLVKEFLHKGLALATTISSVVTILLFMFSLYKKIGDFYLKRVILTGVKSILSCSVMCLILNRINEIWEVNNDWIKILDNVLLGAMIYTIMMLLLKESMLYDIVYKIKKKKEN